MKKHLFLALALCIGLTSFAAPWDIKPIKNKILAWDKPLQISKVVFDDPFITDFSVGELSFPRRLHFWVEIDHATTVKLRLVVMVWGYWADIADSGPKYFDVPINTGHSEGTLDWTLASGDVPVPSFYDFMSMDPW